MTRTFGGLPPHARYWFEPCLAGTMSSSSLAASLTTPPNHPAPRIAAKTVVLVVVMKEIFDETQRRRLASLGQKFLRAFRRERSRDWLPNRGSDRQLSIVYGPSSPWGKREALRLRREKNKQSEKVRQLHA